MIKQTRAETQTPVERMSRLVEIRCKTTGRLLARASEDGPELFCRMHNTSHKMSWQEWEALQRGICEGTASTTYWVEA